MIWFSGIDPGVEGAFAAFDGSSLSVWDMPVEGVNFKRNSTKKRVSVLNCYIECVKLAILQPKVTLLEASHGRPGQSGQVAVGRCAGILEMGLTVAGVEYETIAPATWKARARVPSNKAAVRALAQAAFPQYAELFSLAKHDGRADAALLAKYAYDRDRGATWK